MKFVEFMRGMFGDKETVWVKQSLETQKYKLAIESFSIQMAINMIAGAISKCEFKTYYKKSEIKGDEYYLWNVEPNLNQNSSEFIQELIAKLLFYNECLVVEVAGKLIIADSFTQEEYSLRPNIFSQVSRGSLTFKESFSMEDVLYFKYGNCDIRAQLSNLMSGYCDLLDMAMGKYKRSGGRKGIIKLGKIATGDTDYKKKLDDLFNNEFKKYFEAENATVSLPLGIDYTEITGEGSRKSSSEIVDIANITKEVIMRVAQAFRIPPALLQGDIADVEKITDNFITFCIDFLADILQTETNRKRYGKAAYLGGSYLRIDTTRIKHIDLFEIAEKADKLIADGMYSIDELREKLGDMPLNTWWSRQHYRTKNYESITTEEGEQTNETEMDSEAAGNQP